MSAPNQAGGLPQTLMEAMRFFADKGMAHEFMVQLRWPDGLVKCPRCASADVAFVRTRRVWECKCCETKRQFSVKTGTIFEESPLGLDKWLATIWLIANAKNGVSSYEVHRGVGVTQKTAWFMLHRIRLAMRTGTFAKFAGEVESDESYFGGKAIFMHKRRRAKLPNKGVGGQGKAIVHGMLERSAGGVSQVRASVVPDVQKATLRSNLVANVEPGSKLYSDTAMAYLKLDAKEWEHLMVDHAEKYVEGQVHTNGIENFWSLFKRGLKGTYVQVHADHLWRYLDEQVMRFNARGGEDADRFLAVARGVIGKRLTYAELTGKTETSA